VLTDSRRLSRYFASSAGAIAAAIADANEQGTSAEVYLWQNGAATLMYSDGHRHRSPG
jgi:hypothetical protein